MRTYLFIILLLSSALSFAQRECNTSNYIDGLKSANPSFAKKLIEVESFIQSRSRLNTAKENEAVSTVSTIKIPVVVHIVYNTAAQNISEAQIKSQLLVLNNDFGRRNMDSSNTPYRFKAIAGNAGIEFVLATADPEGRPTTGIVRKQTNIVRFKGDDKIKSSSEGGSAAWDSRFYLNIWVGNMESVIGYSSVPGSAADKDGVVIAYTSFGTINTNAPYNLGRTAVHEVGHWLGLKHIWGDTYCGDDRVDDTPQQGNFTPGCPTTFRSTCNNGSQGDMYMNFMDYTNDACMNLFTHGQCVRMRTLFDAGGARATLLQSKGLDQPWVAALPGEETTLVPQTASHLYPNPVTNNFTVELTNDFIGKTAVITNMNGAIISHFVFTGLKQTITVAGLSKGVYLLQAETADKKWKEKFVKL